MSDQPCLQPSVDQIMAAITPPDQLAIGLSEYRALYETLMELLQDYDGDQPFNFAIGVLVVFRDEAEAMIAKLQHSGRQLQVCPNCGGPWGYGPSGHAVGCPHHPRGPVAFRGEGL